MSKRDPVKDPPVDGETFVKHDAGKLPMSLIPPIAIEEMATVLGYGAKKYAPHNWRSVGDDWEDRYMSAALRHMMAHMRGERCDTESGISHLAHALCNLAFLVELAAERGWTEKP
jgi:hypothetical protein